MDTSKQLQDGHIIVGPFAFSRNSFLLVLACIAAVLFCTADLVGVERSAGRGLLAGALAPQMVWAYLMLGLTALANRAFHRAGYSSTATSCWVIAISFLVGAAAYTLQAS